MFCCLFGLFHEGVFVPVGFAVEAEDPTVVDDAVDDRGGHVPVSEHVAPSAGLEVRGEDDAAGLVAVRAGLEQKPGPIDLSSASNLLSSLAFLNRMIRLEAVKNR